MAPVVTLEAPVLQVNEATAADAIGHEILTRLGSRFRRRYIRPGSGKQGA